MYEAKLSRRSALALGIGAATVLAGCGNGKRGGGDTVDKGGKLAKVPTYVAPPRAQGGLYSDVPGVPPGYPVLPDKLFATTEAPFTGKPVSVLSIAWGNPPSKFSDNRYWQILNEALGVDYAGIFVPFDSYDAKIATTLASGDLPDVTELIPSPPADKAIRQGAFADLTEALSGDNIKKYKNLAAIRPDQWKSSAINGRIMGVPIDLPLCDVTWLYRGDWAAKLGYPDVPKTPEEFLTVMAAISKGHPAHKKTYGIGSYGGSFGSSTAQFINCMFRVPNEWRLDKDGTLTNQIDTHEYEQAISFTRDLWKAGAFHPDAIALGDQGAKTIDMFTAGQTAFVKGGLAGAINEPFVDMWMDNAKIQLLVPPGQDGKGFTFPISTGWYGRSVIPAKAAKDPKRLHEILQVIDYMWAPFGSVERLIGSFGKEGVTYDMKNGYPVARTDSANANDVVGFESWTAPFYYQSPRGKKAIQTAITYCEAMVKSGVANPVASVYSPTSARLSSQMKTLQQDYINQIVTGRRPMSDLKKYRQAWHQRGGDQIISELKRGLHQAGH